MSWQLGISVWLNLVLAMLLYFAYAKLGSARNWIRYLNDLVTRIETENIRLRRGKLK